MPGSAMNTAGQTHSMEEKCCWSSSLSKDALSVFDEVSVAPFFKVGTWLEVFIKYLTAFQNCLLPKFDILSKWFFFDCLSSCTTSFLNSTYLNHREEWPSFSVGAVSLPNRSFDLFIQGRFRITVWTNISWLYIPQVSMYAILLLTFHLVAWSTETALKKQKITICCITIGGTYLLVVNWYIIIVRCMPRRHRELYWFVRS